MTDIVTRLEGALAGHYQVERPLGAGGMAMVYLARDLRHGRLVALKVLRPELAVVIGAERFLAEIRLTANLQHPHILPLHDSGEADGLVYYVMPFIEGESLRDRLTREHQLPIEDAVRIAREVADALDYAHEQGVIHRDVKPENILLHGGHALVADFGIALAASRTDGASRMTETGMSLGTPAYMAPEQAMGEREITRRADVYALGAVLYEMLSGEPPFVGPTAQAVVARMMTEEPRRLSLQRHTIPPHVEAAVVKALEKLPADRFGSARDFAAALRDTSFVGDGGTLSTRGGTGRHAMAPGARRSRLFAVLPWAVATVAVLLLAGALARRAPRPAPIRYGLGLPAGQTVLRQRAIPSPDGASLLFVGPQEGQTSDVVTQLWLKRRDRHDAVPVPETEGVWNVTFSPDGRWIAYVRDGRLLKAPLAGGPAVLLADSVTIDTYGLAWLEDGSIVYLARNNLSLRRVPSSGGPSEVVHTSPVPLFEPSPLPDNRGVLIGTCTDGACSAAKLLAVTFDADSPRVLVRGAGMGRVTPTGHLVFLRDNFTLAAAPFDAGRLELSGAPVTIMDSIAPAFGGPEFDLSVAGTLVFRRGGGGGLLGGLFEMVWVDRAGAVTPLDMGDDLVIDPGGGNPGWALSPDGSRLAIALLTPAGGDVWVKELPSGPLSRVTFDSLPDLRPRWAPDGRNLTYVAVRGARFDLRLAGADGRGADSIIASHPDNIYEGAVSPDGEWIVTRVRGGLGRQGRDIVGFRRGDSMPVPLIANRGFDENAFQLSPDGRWIAYESDESGSRQVYVRPFPSTGDGKWQASTSGGYAPLWARSGRELFFVNSARQMTVVPFTPGAPAPMGERRVLFTLSADLYLWENDYYTPFDISRDGRRFLMARQVETGPATAPLLVTENWFTELEVLMEGRD